MQTRLHTRKPVKTNSSCRALATYKLQTLVQPDNHVMQKFHIRKICAPSNEVIFSPPFLSLSALLLLNLAQRQCYAYVIGLFTRPEIKIWPHVIFCDHAQCVLPRCCVRYIVFVFYLELFPGPVALAKARLDLLIVFIVMTRKIPGGILPYICLTDIDLK